MVHPLRLLFILVLLLSLSLSSGSAVARCFGVPEEAEELGEGWRIHLTASADGYEDGVDFGMAEGASINLEPGVDAIENFSVRKPFFLYFLYPFPDTGFNYFDVSIVGTRDSRYWPLTLDVRVARTLDITITWSPEEVANVSSEWDVAFIDHERNRVDMREVNAVALAVGQGVYDMRVAVSRGDERLDPLVPIALVVAGYGAAVAVFLALRRRRKRR